MLVTRETILCVWKQIFRLWPRGFAYGIKKENAFKRISCKQIWVFFSVACSWIEMIVCETVFNSWKQVSLSWQRILQHFTMSLAHEENICLWCFLLIKRCFCKNTILLLVNKNIFIQSHVKKQIYDQTFFLMAKQNCRWKTNYVKKKDSHCCWLVKKKNRLPQTRLSSLEVFSDDLLMSQQKDDIKKNFSNSLLQIQFRSPATEKHWAKQNQSRSTRRWALETETWRRLQQQLDTLTSHLRVGLQLLWGLQLPESRRHLVWESHRRKVNVYEETVSRCFYLVQLISHINKDTTHMKAETWFFIIWTKTEQHLIKHKIILLQNVYRTFIVDLLYS